MAHASSTDIQQYLSGIDYPCSKEDLVEHARSQGADDDTIDTLQNLPQDTFDSPADVSKAVGQTE